MVKSVSIIFEGRADLNKEAYSVAFSYYSRIKRIKFIKYAKINIFIHDKVGNVDIVGLDDRVCNVNYALPISSYISLPENERREKLYEITFNAMKYLALANGWDEFEIEEVNQSIMKSHYIISVGYFKKKRSPSKKISAMLNFIVDFQCTRFYWDVFDKEGKLIKSVLVYKSVPVDMLYPIFFNSYEWISDEEIVIKDMFEEICFISNITTGNVRIELKPGLKSETDLRKKLKGFDCETSDAERSSLVGFLFG